MRCAVLFFTLFLVLLCPPSFAGYSSGEGPELDHARTLLLPWFSQIENSIKTQSKYQQFVQSLSNSSLDAIDCWLGLKETGDIEQISVRAKRAGIDENRSTNLDAFTEELVRNSAPFSCPPPSILPSVRKHILIRFTRTAEGVRLTSGFFLRPIRGRIGEDQRIALERYISQGLACQQKEQFADAISCFDRALMLDSANLTARLSKAVSCMCSGVSGNSEANELAAWIRLFGRPDFPRHKTDEEWKRAAVFAAMSYRQCNENELAASLLSESIGLGDSKVWIQKALLFLDKKASAKELLESAEGNETTLAEAHCYIGFDSMLAGDKATAKQHFSWIKEHVVGSASDLPETTLAASLLKTCQ